MTHRDYVSIDAEPHGSRMQIGRRSRTGIAAQLRLFVLSLVIIAVVSPVSSAATTFDVAYGAILKLLHQQVYRYQGRAYLEGNAQSPCAYAYLEQPRINAQADRLTLASLFVGRAALEVSGECLGTDEARFWAHISGVPRYENGMIVLTDATISVPENVYSEVIRNYFQTSLAPLLRYPLLSEVRQQIIELSAQTPYRLELVALDVPSIILDTHQMRITIDATLRIH